MTIVPIIVMGFDDIWMCVAILLVAIVTGMATIIVLSNLP